MEDKVIYRDYLALCQGQLKKADWIITDKIGRDRHDRRKRVVDNRKGQAALTQVRRLKTLGKNSLVSCRLQTGRTHQIRVHLSHHGHALIGDPLYSRVAAPRLMLHAQKLSLTHPLTLEEISVEARSESFEKVLKNMK